MKNHSNATPLNVLQILCQQPGKTGSGVFVQAIVSQAFQKGYRQRVVIGVPGNTPYLPIPPLQADSIFPVYFDSAELPFPVAGMSDIMPYVSTRFSTFTPIQKDPVIGQWYQAKADPKVKMKTVIACLRKLAKALWHVARGERFDARKLVTL